MSFEEIEMKKLARLLFSLAITVALPGTSVMAEPEFMRDVNTACNTGLDIDETQITVECSVCHDLNDFDQETYEQELYESYGACIFCTENTSCAPVRPTKDELLADAKAVTKQYFQELFKEFMIHMMKTGMMDPDDGTITDPMIFAEVFPDCSQIAPVIGGDFSRETGYQVRRVTNRTRNARNTPDGWEAKQLEEFEKMAKQGKQRTEMIIKKPDGSKLTTMEFEAYGFVNEEDVEYFRYMRSITMPGPPNEPPHLPCLKCHGTFDQLGPGLVDVDGDIGGQGVLEAEYPYDMALGYKKGDIRGAWTIKIPIVEGEDD
jgi:hypothetical protein